MTSVVCVTVVASSCGVTRVQTATICNVCLRRWMLPLMAIGSARNVVFHTRSCGRRSRASLFGQPKRWRSVLRSDSSTFLDRTIGLQFSVPALVCPRFGKSAFCRTWVAEGKTVPFEEKEAELANPALKIRDKNYESALLEARKYVAHLRDAGLASGPYVGRAGTLRNEKEARRDNGSASKTKLEDDSDDE
eukprot:m.333141 g.333141  ORF g.333141 m.333141 type:complete len:191 (+) comp55647_c0_seq1:4200-4772(+)